MAVQIQSTLGQLARWLEELSQYSFVIQHRAENHMAMLMLCQGEMEELVIATMLASALSLYNVEAANTAERLKSSGKGSQMKLIMLFH